MRMMLLLSVLWTGCSVLRDAPEAGEGEAVFPHPTDFGEGVVHGASLASAEMSTCLGCHDVSEGETRAAPACRSCHEDYPHSLDWWSGEQHGTRQHEGCGSCHDRPGFEATFARGCVSCHASYPHPDGWSGAGEHGAYAASRGGAPALCGGCHSSGSDAAVPCTDCHLSWPHADDWALPGEHGAAAADPDTCRGCHVDGGADWSGSPAGVACSTCHATYPHEEQWRAGHLSAAGVLGEETCMGCHDAGDGPSGVVATCATQCHGAK